MCEVLPTATFVNPGRSMRVKFTTANKTMQNNYATQIKVLPNGTLFMKKKLCCIFSSVRMVSTKNIVFCNQMKPIKLCLPKCYELQQ
jgi:hypothetical protein